MTAALVLHPNGDITELNLPTDPDKNVAAMREAIGCALVDVVRLTTTLDMWIDDEGLYTQEPNPIATALARRHGYRWQPYHGPVVLCSMDDEGRSVDLNRDQLLGLLSALDDIATA